MTGKYTQKPRAEQIYLFCRGDTVYMAKPNIAEAESNANKTSRRDRDGQSRNPPDRGCRGFRWAVFRRKTLRVTKVL